MAQKNPWPGYPMQNVPNSGQPRAVPYPQCPPENHVSSYPIQNNHPPQSNQQYPQQYSQLYHQQYPQLYQVHQQPGYGIPYPADAYGQLNYGPPPPYAPVAPHPAAPQQMVQGTFDSGARFVAGATANIPPAPPGVMPTHGQIAASRGQPVAMQQPKAGWLEGARGGGYTFW